MAPLPRRICLIGPECTAKTTLGQRLARELGAAYVAEYAREYAEPRGNELSASDVAPIARGQMANDDAARDADRIVLDTDLISTVVYARHYYGACPAWIEEEAHRRRADLYQLMDTDLDWVSDPARDTGGDAREDLFDAFRAALDEFETTWVIVSGEGEERWKRVLAAANRESAMAIHDLRHVPVARSPLRRMIGLIGRTDSARMFLFIPRCSAVHTWFMSAAIDIVFLDVDGVVVSIAREARPWRIYPGSSGTRSVLELPAGYSERSALMIGDVVVTGSV